MGYSINIAYSSMRSRSIELSAAPRRFDVSVWKAAPSFTVDHCGERSHVVIWCSCAVLIRTRQLPERLHAVLRVRTSTL